MHAIEIYKLFHMKLNNPPCIINCRQSLPTTILAQHPGVALSTRQQSLTHTTLFSQSTSPESQNLSRSQISFRRRQPPISTHRRPCSSCLLCYRPLSCIYTQFLTPRTTYTCTGAAAASPALTEANKDDAIPSFVLVARGWGATTTVSKYIDGLVNFRGTVQRTQSTYFTIIILWLFAPHAL